MGTRRSLRWLWRLLPLALLAAMLLAPALACDQSDGPANTTNEDGANETASANNASPGDDSPASTSPIGPLSFTGVELPIVGGETLGDAGAYTARPEAVDARTAFAFLLIDRSGALCPYSLDRLDPSRLPRSARFSRVALFVHNAIERERRVVVLLDRRLESAAPLCELLEALRGRREEIPRDALLLAVRSDERENIWRMLPILPPNWGEPEPRTGQRPDADPVLLISDIATDGAIGIVADGRWQPLATLDRDVGAREWTATLGRSRALRDAATEHILIYQPGLLDSAEVAVNVYASIAAVLPRPDQQLGFYPGAGWPGPPELDAATLERGDGDGDGDGDADTGDGDGDGDPTAPAQLTIEFRKVPAPRAPLPAVAEYASGDTFDLGAAAILAALAVDPNIDVRDACDELNDLAEDVADRAGLRATPRALFEIVADVLYRERMLEAESDPEVASRLPECNVLPAVLRHGRGNCQSFTILTLAILDRLGVGERFFGVELPGHVFVRYDDGEQRLNHETTARGAELTDEGYARKFDLPHPLPDDSPFGTNCDRRQSLAFVLNNLAIIVSDDRRHEDAVELLDLALELHPDHVPALFNRGAERIELGEPEAALVDLSRARTLFAEQPKVCYAMAKAYRMLDRLEESLAVLDEAIAFIEREPNLRFELYLQRGLTRDRLGHYDDAVEDFERARDDADCPNVAKPELETHIGQAHLAAGEVDDAIESLQRALALFDALAESGQEPDAMAVTACLRSLIVACQRKGDAEGARDAIRRALEIEPDAAELWVTLGEIEREKGDLDAAKEAYEKALEFDRNDIWARLRLGELALDEQEFDKTIAHCEVIAAHWQDEPDSGEDVMASALQLGGRARIEKGDFNGALVWLRRLDEMSPELRVRLLPMRAECYHRLDDYDRALEALDEYARLGGNDRDILDWRERLREEQD